jgi:hypothetical protein
VAGKGTEVNNWCDKGHASNLFKVVHAYLMPTHSTVMNRYIKDGWANKVETSGPTTLSEIALGSPNGGIRQIGFHGTPLQRRVVRDLVLFTKGERPK